MSVHLRPKARVMAPSYAANQRSPTAPPPAQRPAEARRQAWSAFVLVEQAPGLTRRQKAYTRRGADPLQRVSRLVPRHADAIAFRVVEEGEPAYALDRVRLRDDLSAALGNQFEDGVEVVHPDGALQAARA